MFGIIYTPGAKWLAGKPVQEQPLWLPGMYMKWLLDNGRLAFAGPFLDEAVGGVAFVRSPYRAAAEAIVAAHPAILDGGMVGGTRPWLAMFDRSKAAAT